MFIRITFRGHGYHYLWGPFVAPDQQNVVLQALSARHDVVSIETFEDLEDVETRGGEQTDDGD